MKTQELRQLAKAATPGPWRGKGVRECGYGWVDAPNGGRCTFGSPVQILKGQYARQADDALYLAAVSPDVVLKLLDDRDNLLKALNEINNWLVCACIATPEDMAQSFGSMQQMADAALAQCEGGVE